MAGTPIRNLQSSPSVTQSQVFRGIRFVLLGFDSINKSQVSRKLVICGGVDAGQYGPDCTHVIVDKLVYDDPLCVAARHDEKILVSSLWVDHSFDVGAPVDTTSVMYTPVRDLNGIPGAKSLVICLTGYQREDREDIMTMVQLMGAQVSKPLIANKVTHLICYKFEGEKYLLAKRVKRIKLINHRWLEDCLKAWEIVPEVDYSKSGYELEMEAEARDSEDEPEGDTTRHDGGNIASPHHSMLLKQEIPKIISNTRASNLFSNAEETVSLTMKTASDKFPNFFETKIKQQDTVNITSVTSEPSNRYGETVYSSPAQDNIFLSSTSTHKSPQNEAKAILPASYSMRNPIRTTPPKIESKSNTSSSKRLNKINLNDSFNVSSSFVQKATPYSGRLNLQQTSQNNEESAFLEIKKDPPIEMSSAQKSPLNISASKTSSSKGKNVICDAPFSKAFTSEIEDLDAVQRSLKEHKETNLSTKFYNRDVGMTENVMQSPSAVSSDLQKFSTLNSEINEQGAGSNSKPVRRNSNSENFSAPKLSKMNNVNLKGSIFLKNTEPGIDDENLFRYQLSKNVSPVAKSGTENDPLCMDHETDSPDDKGEAIKEKYEDGEPDDTVDASMGEADGNVDVVDPSTNKNENDLLSIKHKVLVQKSDGNTKDLAIEITRTKRGKKYTDFSKKKATDKKSLNKNKLLIENSYGKQEIREEATQNQSDRACTTVNDLEKSMEVNRVGVCNYPELNNDENNNDVDADKATENVVNKIKDKRNKHPPSKANKDVSKRNAPDLEKSVDAERAEGDFNDHKNEEKENKRADKDVDIDVENVLNKKEIKRNKRPLSRSKKDDAKTVNKKGKMISDLAVETNNIEEKDYNRADKDADVDTENVLNKKETNRNKLPLRTKKDDAKTVSKKGKPTSNKVSIMRDLEEARNENVQIHINDQIGGKKHAFKHAKEILDKNHIKDEPIWFILTGHKLQRREFQQIIKRLKGRVCRVTHNWSYQATHFIVPDPIRRTEKFFAAAASGRWILKSDYLTASNQAGKFLPEEAYEWHKFGLSEDGQVNLEAPRKWRLLKEKTGHGAFYGMKIVIYGECISPPLDTLKRAVKAGDGIILATSPPYTRFLTTGIDFAVVSPGMPHVDIWVQEFLKHEIPCVSSDYLVEYVCKPGYPLEKHVQYGTNVWAERSYKSLKNRFEEDISEPRTPDGDDVACEVCGARDRGEEMLICGSESGSTGCSIGTHIGCCDPPLERVPEDDWFCSRCIKEPINVKEPKNSKAQKGIKNERSASRV
ncbi:hypothetical protein R6Q57_028105 [Mikania cordata]